MLENLQMTKSLGDKLHEAFEARFLELRELKSNEVAPSTQKWRDYLGSLEGVEYIFKRSDHGDAVDYLIERINEGDFNKYVIRWRPSPYENKVAFIVLTKEAAEKILTLGLP